MASMSLRFSSCSGICDKDISSAFDSRFNTDDSLLWTSPPLDSLSENTSQFSTTGFASGFPSSALNIESEQALFLDLPVEEKGTLRKLTVCLLRYLAIGAQEVKNTSNANYEQRFRKKKVDGSWQLNWLQESEFLQK